MPSRRAVGRLRGLARRLPAILLSGLVVFVTAGLPATATTVTTREPSAATKLHDSGGVTVVADHVLPDATGPVAAPASEPGLVPERSAGTVVSPLDLYTPRLLNGVDNVWATLVGAGAHPDRAPPVVDEQ